MSPAFAAGADDRVAPGAAEGRVVPDTRQQITMSFAPLVEKIAPAVVNIYTKRTITRAANPFMEDPFFKQFFGNNFGGQGLGGLSRKQVEGALGSGVIVDDTGLVVTNAHVVRGADAIRVGLSDGREFDAKVTLLDEHSDLAMLRLSVKGEKLPYATFRPSESLKVGDLVIAIGNPFGVGQTVTSGIVSALARSSLNINDYNFFIQTDAAINPGNSGGPLVAMDGSVVGINSAIYSQSGGSLGIGFAIPSEMVATVIAAEKAGQTGTRGIPRPWLGVTSQGITPEIADSIGLKTPSGTLISGLNDASPLKKAGVQVGDVIVSMNGHPIHDASEMKYRIATVPLGSTATIGVFRKGKTFDTKVTAIAPPDTPARDQTTLGVGLFAGATISNLNPAVANEVGYNGQNDDGVVITKVDGQSVAARFLEEGDMIVQLNGQDIKRVADLKHALATPPDQYNVIINRRGQVQQLVVR